jgi:hypothetical protein
MTSTTDEDFEARLTRVLTQGAEQLPVGRVVPAFNPTRPPRPRQKRGCRRISRKVAVAGVAVGLVVTGSAAAAVVDHVTTSAPVTETDEARCYSTASLAGGDNFTGLTTTAAGPIGSDAQVTNALADCRVDWRYGFLTLGSTQKGGTRPPSGALDPNHAVPPLVVCVLPSGIAAVIPGPSTTCQSLGLPPAQRK